MPVNYPKFDKKIQEQIDLTNIQKSKTRPGIIASFDKKTNTATVMLEDYSSEYMGNIMVNVPCPVIRGIQNVSPVTGTRCLVAFRDNNESNPYVVNYFEDTNINKTYSSNYLVQTGIPRFMVD
jgi:hypothetical protein